MPWGIATKRLSVDEHGRVVYRYKRPFRDGSTHVMLEPLDFMARLAALVPRPRLNLTRFHGVFAPNARHRHQIVPRRAPGRVDADKPLAPLTWPLPHIHVLRGTWTPVQWALRLKRVFEIDIEACLHCGGKLRVIACIEDPPLIRKILEHVQQCGDAGFSQARAPPVRDGARPRLN